MQKSLSWLFCLAMIVLLMSGCAPLVIGGAAVGTGTGTYFYISGEMPTDYPYTFDKVWVACEKTLADMRAQHVEPYKEIGKGTISSVVRDEEVQIILTYKTKNLTNVAVRVGMFGDKTAAQMLQDSIADNIARN